MGMRMIDQKQILTFLAIRKKNCQLWQNLIFYWVSWYKWCVLSISDIFKLRRISKFCQIKFESGLSTG